MKSRFCFSSQYKSIVSNHISFGSILNSNMKLRNFHENWFETYVCFYLKSKTSLSWVVPNSVVWVEVELSWDWVELRLSWVEAELELKLSWDWAWQVFELFNWSIWSLQLKYLKSSIEVFEVLFHFTTFPVGWMGGCVIRK